MKLYYSPGACSLASHIAMNEAGMKVQLVKADTKTREVEGGGRLEDVNSKGYVPVLELDNGDRLTEGPAILQYVADQAPQSGLAPANGTLPRYELQSWLNYITSELHKTIGALFNPKLPAESQAFQRQNSLKRLKWVDEQLAGRTFLTGDAFTVADAYLFVVTNWTSKVGIDISDLKNLQAFQGRVAARPAVQAALKEEGLI